MAATHKRPGGDVRRGLIAKIHVAKKQLCLADDDYRAMLRRVTGRESAGACSIGQLEAVLDYCRHDLGWQPKKTAPARAATKRPLADGREARKARALWLSLYHLGVVRDPSEPALERFLERQSGGRGRGVLKLQWMTGEQALKVIEALKAWAARPLAEGGADVFWGGYHDKTGALIGYNPRRRVVEAQARILELSQQEAEVLGFGVTGVAGFAFYAPKDWDRLIEALGDLVRKVRHG